jgi:uncharacterized membrane protein YhaH (DUF805 family)
MQWYLKAMRSYAVFQGRSPRIEFIEVFGGLFLLILVAQGMDQYLFGGDGQEHTLLTTLVILVHLVPSLAVTARRLHDIGQSGWFALLGLVPVIGTAILLLAFPRGTPSTNRYGANPLGTTPSPTPAAETLTQTREAASPAPTAGPVDLIAELERLAALRAKGGLSEAEFEVMKAQLLAQGR